MMLSLFKLLKHSERMNCPISLIEFDKDIFYEIYDIVEYFNSKQDPEFPYYKPILGVMHNDIDTSKKRNNKVHLHLILCYDYKYLNSFRFNDKQKTLVYKEKYF